MWKDFVAINGSECVRALTICIAIDDPLGGGRSRREELSALTPTPNRLYIGSVAVNPTEGITYSEASLRSLMAARSTPGGFIVTNPGSFMATITHPTGIARIGYCVTGLRMVSAEQLTHAT